MRLRCLIMKNESALPLVSLTAYELEQATLKVAALST